MSLDALRQACIKSFQERADTATSKALNLRPRAAGQNLAAMTAEEYAMFGIDALAEARTYLECQRIITNEFRKLTQPEQKIEEPTEQKPARKMYG